MTEARSIAIVGASERNELARITIDNLTRLGFSGSVVGIHPSAKPVDGIETFASYDDAGGPVDLAVLAVGAPRVVEALRTAAAAGVPGAIVPGSGANEGGRAIWDDLRRAVEDTGIAVVGPNCMGFASLHQRVVPYVGTLDPDLQAGTVGLVSQSGSVCELFTTMPWRVGLSHVVSVGNEASVDLTEALAFLVDDPGTGSIGLFIEGVRRPDAFREALRRAAEAGKPVVALKVGRSELSRAGTVSHTGALAGDARVFSAVLRAEGATEIADLDELQVTLELLGKGLRRPPGRVVFVGDSGGQANLFADLAAARGVELPALGRETCRALGERFPSLDPCANPLDLWALGDPEDSYRDGVRLVVEREPHLVVFGVDKFLARTESELAFVRAGLRGVDRPGAAVLMAFGGSETADPEVLRGCWERGIPVTRGADRTLAALAAMAAWRRGRDRPADDGAGPTVDDDAVRAAFRATTEWTEHSAKEVVAAAGIPVTREREAADPTAAVAAAREVGFPVVVKMAGEGVAHKTEAGGVRLGLASEEDVAAAAEELLALGPRVLVAEHRRADLEVIAGAFVDEQFGPCGLLGLGGAWTEALGQAVVIAGPATAASVQEALEGAAWGRLLLRGTRGRRFPAGRVIDALLRLMAVTAACPVSEIEINPLLCVGDDVVAVDALVVPREEGAP